jgi:hypothetical protein
MGFQKPDLDQAMAAIRRSLVEIRSPYNDGWTSSACKKDLYQLKCWLEDEYAELPEFDEEKSWEQERLVRVLKKS